MNVNGFLFIYPLFMSMLIYGGFCNAHGILSEKHDVISAPHGLPEFAAVAFTSALHVWRRNMLLSAAEGTAVYVSLLHFVG